MGGVSARSGAERTGVVVSTNPVRSREHALHMLAEAAELEHNLLCSYLYAAFSLKRGLDEDLLPNELEAVERWHATIMEVCMEEMTHLAQVANLMVALGSRPHFDRPNLPVDPGYHPARVQVALTPFDLETLEHFIFLERPETSKLEDARWFRPAESYRRQPEVGALMPSAPDYATIGEFYELLVAGLRALATGMGEDKLFVGPVEHQLRPEEIGTRDLFVVRDVATAAQALHLIVVQGEGASGESEASHFDKFSRIKDEYVRLAAERPAFRPSRKVARNPVMRRPVAEDRVHVTHPQAAALLDATNAVYSLMLRCLTAVYDTASTDTALRKALLGCAMGLMKMLAQMSGVLTRLPAAGEGDDNAGVTFAMLRSTEGLVAGVDIRLILTQRFDRIREQIPALPFPADVAASLMSQLAELGQSLAGAEISRPSSS
jgi:hypothetical protein